MRPSRFALLAVLSAPVAAQDGAIPGLDVSLGDLADIDVIDRDGFYPTGTVALSMETTACNPGTVTVPWEDGSAPGILMYDDHPWIAMMAVVDDGMRMKQISGRTYMKAGFGVFGQNVCDICSNCGPFSLCDFLAPGCSDTYTVSLNGNHYYLAPTDELDPWNGTWDPYCTHFDRGYPGVAPPADCDGERSLTGGQASTMGAIGGRVAVSDAELITPGGVFAYQAYYAVKNEPGDNRDNNFGSRLFDPSFNGSSWSTTTTSALLPGSVLQRWNGSSLSSGANGGDDGAFYVAVRVTGPDEGFFHYEYAIQNRDNSRGGGGIRIPVCPDARVINAGFHDIDDDAGNDWTLSHVGDEIVVQPVGDNPIEWNTIYNVWFDSDAGPRNALMSIEQHLPGPGADDVLVLTSTPQELPNVFGGAGCNSSPGLYATGTPPIANLGNATFGVATIGAQAGGVVLPFVGFGDGALPLGSGCTAWMNVTGAMIALPPVVADGGGTASVAIPIPNNPGLDGATIRVQGLAEHVSGPLFGGFETTDALRVRVGDTIGGCP